MTRVLQVVKTTSGARWAAWQTGALAKLGFEMHVVMPQGTGEAVRLWQASGATMHEGEIGLPLARPAQWRERRREILEIVKQVKPDLIHSHFLTSTLALRLALGRNHSTPILFQVPGPLHLEAGLTRRADLMSAGKNDFWAPSSLYSHGLYRRFGAARERVFLGYYGFPLEQVERGRTGALRAEAGLEGRQLMVGNINNIYPPKLSVGQTIGSKGHEYVIDALALVCGERKDVTGVLVGGQWEGGTRYREQLMRRARDKAGERIRFVVQVGFEAVNRLWADYDCAVHLPISENCGGVIEPLAAEVPTVAAEVGGLPEVVVDGVTGALTRPRDAAGAAERILNVLEHPEQAKQRARVGRELVLEMFGVERTAEQMARIYEYVLGQTSVMPPIYDSARRAQELAKGMKGA